MVMGDEQQKLKDLFKKKAEKKAKKKAKHDAYRADQKARAEDAQRRANERKEKARQRRENPSPWLRGGSGALSDLAGRAGMAMGEMMGDRSNDQALQNANWEDIGSGKENYPKGEFESTRPNLNQLGTASGVMGDPGMAGAMGDPGDPGLAYELSGSGPFDPANMNAPSGFASGNQAPLPTNQEYRDPQPPSAANYPPGYGTPDPRPDASVIPSDNNVMLNPIAAAMGQVPEQGKVEGAIQTASDNITNMFLPQEGPGESTYGDFVDPPLSLDEYGVPDDAAWYHEPGPVQLTPDPLSQIKPSMLNPPGGMGPAPTTSDAGITPDFPQMTPGPDSTYPELGMTPTAPPIGAIDYEALQDPGNLGMVEGMVEGDAARLGGMPPEDLRPLNPFGGPALADPAPVPGASGVAPYQGVGQPALRDLAMKTETPSAFGGSAQSQAYRDMFPNRQQPAANHLAGLSAAATGGDPSIGMMPNPLNTGSPAGPGLGGGVMTKAPRTTRFNV